MLLKNLREEERRCISVFILSIFFVGLLFLGCGGGGGSSSDSSDSDSGIVAPYDATVSWTANREAAVNITDGGYRVYYSRTPNFDINSATVVDVPYTSGSLAPTSTVIPQLPSGTFYFKVVAYSSMNNTGSVPSSERSITIK